MHCIRVQLKSGEPQRGGAESRRHWPWQGVGLALSLVGLLTLVGPRAAAQVASAAIVGTVTDASGAAVPGVTVRLTNPATGIARTAQTGAAGEYAFNLLPLGTYTVAVTGTGFKRFQATGIKLSPGARVRVNAALAVGAQSQSIEVSASASPLLQTETSAVSTNLGSEAVQSLPIQGRNYMNLVTLSAGVTTGLPGALSSGTRPDDRRQSSSYAANGLSDIANDNLIDGMDNNERFIGTIGVRPAPDAIEQVRVLTGNYTAAVGRTAGGVVDLVTKSGTNQFHGSLYEFLGNDVVDARDFFSTTKPELRLNQFGGSLGGPIIRNKTFFFGDYEGYRQNLGIPVTASVPTAYEQAHPGDFSDIGGPVIPAAQITTVGTNLLTMFPAPTPGLGANVGYNYAAAPVRTQRATTFDGRIDQHLSDNDSIFGRYTFNDTTTVTPDSFPAVTVGTTVIHPGASAGSNAFPGPALERQQALALAYTHVFGPTLVAELKAGYMRSAINSNSVNTGVDAATLVGFPCTGTSCINVPGVNAATGLPRVDFPGTPYAAFGDYAYIPLVTIDNDFQYMGTINWTHGTHNVQIGTGLIRRQLIETQSSNPRGTFDFRGLYTGNALGDLLTGQAATSERSNFLPTPHYRSWEPSAYIQDDWHALSWLTLNVGVRYEIFTPLTETRGQFSNYDPALGVLVSPSLPGINNSNRNAGVKTDMRDVAPRTGFSAALGHSTVVRGGYGRSYFPDGFGSPLVMRNAPFNYSYGCGVAPFSTTACAGAFALSNGGANVAAGLPVPQFNAALATDPANYKGTSISSVAFHFPSAHVDQVSLGVEKSWAGNRFAVGYVGNWGHDLSMGVPINQPVTNVAPYPIPSLPGVGISELESAAISRYDSMQMSVVRPFSHDLSVSFNWTWAHTITNGSVPSEGGPPTPCSLDGCLMDNPSDPSHPIVVNGWQQYSLGNSALDVRHHVAATLVWQIPFGHSLHGLGAQLVGGWSLNATGVYQTGLPFTVTNNKAYSGVPGIGSDLPNAVGSYAVSNPTVEDWFNLAAFKQQTPGTQGNERPFQLHGPPNRAINLGLAKTFTLTEGYHIEFRADSYNITNTANFANPGAGIVSYNADGVAQAGGSFGQITSTAPGSTPRQLQFALRLLF